MSIAAIRQAQDENSNQPFLVLLTFYLAPATTDVRIVNNTLDIVSRGQTFIGCPFAIALPDGTDQIATGAEIEVDNVDTRMWQGVRALSEAPLVKVEVVLSTAPNTVLVDTDGLRLREVTATRATLRGKLVPDSIWQAGFPAHEFDPRQFQGLFGT
jgi:hypothetical protein